MPEKEPRPSLNYGRAIETLRRERGMTHEALAAASGVSASYLSEVERGFKRPSTDVLAKLAQAFGMRPSRLLKYVESLEVAPPPAPRIEPSRITQERPALGSRSERPRPAATPIPRSQAIRTLAALADQLNDDDLGVVLELARHLLEKSKHR